MDFARCVERVLVWQQRGETPRRRKHRFTQGDRPYVAEVGGGGEHTVPPVNRLGKRCPWHIHCTYMRRSRHSSPSDSRVQTLPSLISWIKNKLSDCALGSTHHRDGLCPHTADRCCVWVCEWVCVCVCVSVCVGTLNGEQHPAHARSPAATLRTHLPSWMSHNNNPAGCGFFFPLSVSTRSQLPVSPPSAHAHTHIHTAHGSSSLTSAGVVEGGKLLRAPAGTAAGPVCVCPCSGEGNLEVW